MSRCTFKNYLLLTHDHISSKLYVPLSLSPSFSHSFFLSFCLYLLSIYPSLSLLLSPALSLFLSVSFSIFLLSLSLSLPYHSNSFHLSLCLSPLPGSVATIRSSMNSNHQIKFSLFESLICTVFVKNMYNLLYPTKSSNSVTIAKVES
jgi:hypothetical protein